MFDRQRLIQHGKVWALLFGCVFLTLSLAGYDPADPPGRDALPVNSPPANPCGPVGALLAHLLFQGFGWAAYLFLLALAAAVLLTARGRAVAEKGLRVLGFGLVVVVAAAAVQRLAPGLRPCPPVGSGGYLGAFTVAFLGGQFGPLGMVLILLTAGFLGLACCYQALVLWPLEELVHLVRQKLILLPRPRASAKPSPRPAPASIAAPPTRFELLDASASSPVGAPFNASAARPPLGRQPSLENSRGGAAASAFEAARNLISGLSGGESRGDGSYQLPPLSLLEPTPAYPFQEHEAKIHARALLLEKTLQEFGYQVRVVQIDTGPVITQFEIELEAGLRVSKVKGLSDDLAIALAVPSVRIVAPIPGKTTVGIEVPNDRRNIVKLGEVVAGVKDHLGGPRIPLFLGKDVKGTPLVFDLADMPHLLIAGRTGTGKSVCLNAMILSILMTRRPDEVRLILIDPKMVELSQFRRVPHLLHPVVTDMKKAESLLAWACDKMDERYAFLCRAGVRDIQSYNKLGADEIFARLAPEDDDERARIPTHMPHIVIIADEMADLMMTAAKEVESHIVRLAQKSRAVGMHLIVATQKPTVDVVTGLIKGNLPARISFQVASRGDSRVVLDEMGADKLLGNGDMLFLIPSTSHIIRAQGTYVSDSEVHRVCEYLQQYPVEFSKELMQLQVAGGPGGKDRGASLRERDELYETAIEVVIREQRGSCSLLQRALGIGYGRAARLIDFMAEDGIVGEFKSGSAREVLYSWEEWEALKNSDGGEHAGSAA